MNFPAAVFAGRWLIWETFRQARASGIFWLMVGISVLCTAACLSVEVTGPDLPPSAASPRDSAATDSGELSLLGGAVVISFDQGLEQAVHLVQFQLAAWVGSAAGLLLALIWTAGFLPAFLEPGAASVLLAKPVPRWYLLAAKYLGILVFVGSQIGLLILGTWLALAVRTGIWDTAYLLCIPLLIVQFAVFFSFSALLAVTTRSTVACVFGSIVFWFLCWGMNFGRHAVVLLPEFSHMSGIFRTVTDTAYWLMPKPADLSMMLLEMLQPDDSLNRLLGTRALQETGAFRPDLSLLSSLLFAAGMLAVSVRQLETTEY
jgi:ABC-type transport system involved in multi-copper enzyme maturation permease subunit